MGSLHLSDLFDEPICEVLRTSEFPIITGKADARKDIPKIHLKCRDCGEIFFPINHHAEDMYIDDDILEDTPPIPLPDSPYWQYRCDFGIGDSKTVYARLNEKHEVDGICIVSESEGIDETIQEFQDKEATAGGD